MHGLRRQLSEEDRKTLAAAVLGHMELANWRFYATAGGSKLKTPDAIHLVTAILHRADEFHTFDETLTALSGNVAGHRLTICKPIAKNSELDLNPPKP